MSAAARYTIVVHDGGPREPDRYELRVLEPGARVEVEVPAEVECPECEGAGEGPDHERGGRWTSCLPCDGRGVLCARCRGHVGARGSAGYPACDCAARRHRRAVEAAAREQRASITSGAPSAPGRE